METYTISQLARAFGLSRSTLLYYDRIGLLRAADRTDAGYRRYSREEYERLERICLFRSAGVPLADVQKILSADGQESGVRGVLERRLEALGEEILRLRSQQHLLTAMITKMAGEAAGLPVDKDLWVEMLAAAGMNEAAMEKWHAEFERRAPEAHHEFLLSLGIADSEARRIREWSRHRAADTAS